MDKPVLVACFGNADAGDDAFGPLVAARLGEIELPPARVVNIAMRPAALLDHLAGCDSLIVVDAVHWPGAPPGLPIDMAWSKCRRDLQLASSATSTHGICVADQLALAAELGIHPRCVWLIGVIAAEAAHADPAAPGRSQWLECAVEQAASRIVARLRTWYDAPLEAQGARAFDCDGAAGTGQ